MQQLQSPQQLQLQQEQPPQLPQQQQQFLTLPSVGTSNNGLDNENSDLILVKNGLIVNQKSNRRYLITEMLGQGTFGQVAKCWSDDFNDYVAVKVIKNQTAYYHQALVEVGILTLLNENIDSEESNHIVRLLDYFVFQRHLCIVFELLSINLFELIKKNQYKGLSLKLVRIFTKQLLRSLSILEDANVIHCDLKPENVLLKSLEGDIKLIDFGSACMEGRTVYSYIQSRFYRSPEVLLGHAYTSSIDMWSLGCVAAELFLGLPLFPGSSEFDLLQRMIQTLGCQPPDNILNEAKQTSRFFKKKAANSTSSVSPPSSPSQSVSLPSPNTSATSEQNSSSSIYIPLSSSEFEAREKIKLSPSKRYFHYTKLEDIILNYTLRQGNTEEEKDQERQNRLSFIDFLRGLVEFDPEKRWSPRQALEHPFISELPFTSPFQPPPRFRRLSRTRSLTVPQISHNPTNGHWCISGLSPRVNNMPPMYMNGNGINPQASYSPFATSYGSYGTSYGSFEESGHSYSNYMHNTNPDHSTPPLYTIPTRPVMHHQEDGYISHNAFPIFSPDHRRLMTVLSEPIQFSSGSFSNVNMSPGTRHFSDFTAMNTSVMNHGRIGASPSERSGSYHGMPLGMSPSQYTSPLNVHSLTPSSPSVTSPLRYRMPVSPLRGHSLPPEPSSSGFSLNGPPSSSQYSRRRARTKDISSGSSANSIPYENSLLRQNSCIYPSSSHAFSSAGDYESPSNFHKHNPTKLSLRGEGSGPSISSDYASVHESSNRNPSPLNNGSNTAASTSYAMSGNDLSDEEVMNESSPPPNPSDWDPNYSDELLLQEEIPSHSHPHRKTKDISEHSSSFNVQNALHPREHSFRIHPTMDLNSINHSSAERDTGSASGKNASLEKASMIHDGNPNHTMNISKTIPTSAEFGSSPHVWQTPQTSQLTMGLTLKELNSLLPKELQNQTSNLASIDQTFSQSLRLQHQHQRQQHHHHHQQQQHQNHQHHQNQNQLQHRPSGLDNSMNAPYVNGQSLASLQFRDGKQFSMRLENQHGRGEVQHGIQNQLLERSSMQMIP